MPEEEPFDADVEYRRRIKDIDQDGYIILDIRTLAEYGQVLENGTAANYWREELETQKYSFNEIEWIRQNDTMVQIKLIRDEDGSSYLLSWPMTNILHMTQRTNSDEVAESIYALTKELQEKDYVERGIKYMEDGLNHIGPHGIGCDCPPEDDMSEHDHSIIATVSNDDEHGNPCDPTHHRAVLSDAGIWTCLDCASQWDQEGKMI